MSYKEIFEDYLTLKIDFNEFINLFYRKEVVVDFENDVNSYILKYGKKGFNHISPKDKSIKNKYFYLSTLANEFEIEESKLKTKMKSLWTYSMFYDSIYYFYSSLVGYIEYNNKYSDTYSKYNWYVGLYDCIYGKKAEELIIKIIDKYDYETSYSKKEKLIRQDIREAFYLKEKKPDFFNVQEWPFSSLDKPMKYVGRKKTGHLVTHTFIEPENGEISIVEEYL